MSLALTNNKKASLTIIFFTVFIDLMGFGILIPILPTFASKNLGVSDFGIGVLVAIYSLLQFIFNPILGRLSDKIGRRPVIITSLSFTAISYLIFSFSTTFWMLFLSRLIAGIGGSNIGVAQAYIADITDKSERSKGMGMIGAAFGLGFVFGPFIGGLLSSYSYMIAGFGASAFSFTAFLFAIFMLPESLKKSSKKKITAKIFEFSFAKRILTQPQLGLLIGIFFIIVFSMANIYGTFALLGYKIYHFSDQQNGYLFGIIGLVSAVMQGGFIRFLSKIFKDKTLVTTGILFMMTGLALIPYGGNFTGLALIAVILSLGTGLLQPVILSMISKHSSDTEQGAVLGLNSSFSSFARVLGPLWGGFAFEFIGYQFPFLTGAFFAVITLLIVLKYLKNE